jgi:spore photoproduct lyase
MSPENRLPRADPSRLISAIEVEEPCLELPLTRRIMERSGNLPITVVAEGAAPGADLPPYPRGLSQGKRLLHLGRNRGRFLKPCPATRNYRCCDYQVLNIGANCPMDCVYCILQAYLNNPWLSFYVNVDDLFRELDQALEPTAVRDASAEPAGPTSQGEYENGEEQEAVSGGRKFWRIGTGEFTDSMALDHLTGLSAQLIEYMADRKNAVLELKSKAVVLDHLPELKHNGRTIMAWSLNSAEVMGKLELHCADLETRLEAAALCASWGYPLAFHFDPIIHHPGWKQSYAATIRRLFSVVPARSIAWISLGAFRFLPALRGVINSRFPNANFIHEEFVPGLDNKFRYFRTLRVGMYQVLVDELARHAAPNTCLYLCMENDPVWREVFGYTPAEKGGLPAMLDAAVQIR